MGYEHTTTNNAASSGAISRELVRRIESGDTDAEAEAWLRYDSSLRKQAWQYADCIHTINDRCSMVWEIALPKLRAGELQNKEALLAYLRGILRSVSLGELRKRPWLTHTGDTDMLEEALVDDSTPFDKVAREQALAATMNLIDDLPVARDREVIMLEFFEETSRDAMCDAYEVSGLQLSRWISRARRRLRESPGAGEALSLASAS